jgi:hypothetical protein
MRIISVLLVGSILVASFVGVVSAQQWGPTEVKEVYKSSWVAEPMERNE